MLRKLYVLLGGCLLSLQAFGQQDPQFSFFMFTPTYLNPAAVGSEGVTRIQLIHRSQWAGYQAPNSPGGGSPTTQLLTVDLPLAKINSGVGIYAFNDNIGPQSSQSLQLAYAYRLPLKNGTLGIGVQAGLYNKRIDYSGIILPTTGPDDLVPTGQYSQFQPDFSAGLYYSTVDYWLGASLYHINTPSFKLGTQRGINPLDQAAYFSAGYKLGLTYSLDLQPSILFKYFQGSGVQDTKSPSSLDLNLLATYDSQYSVGISYRTQESITALATANVLNNKARVGFAYDIVTFGQYAKRPGSFEFMLSYVLPAPNSTPKPIVRTPRFRY